MSPTPSPLPAPGLKITPGLLIDILTLTGASMKTNGVIGPDGLFVKDGPALVAEDVALVAVDVETALQAKGLPIPPNVHKIIQLVPGILQLLSVTLG